MKWLIDYLLITYRPLLTHILTNMSAEDSKDVTLSPEEARERRRAKILASKEARMARITGAHKGASQESLLVDEVVLQEYIAEAKKQAVDLAKEDYSQTHKENVSEPDEPLSPEQVKARQKAQLQARLTQLHQNSPASRFDLFFTNFIVIISAVSGAYFMLNRLRNPDFKLCLDFAGKGPVSVEQCRQEILPVALQTLPSSLVMAHLTLISDFFKGRKSAPQVLAALIPRTILFLVILIIALKMFIKFQ